MNYGSKYSSYSLQRHRTSPRVTVIIPNYNYEDYVTQAVDSALNQRNIAVEVIVVDDGSTDSSLTLLRSYGTRINLIATENNGSILARNIALSRATGDFICYLDSDDYFLDGRLSDHITFMIERKLDFSFCQFKFDGVNEDSKALNQVITRKDFLCNPAISQVIPSSVVMTRSLVEKVGYWDTNLSSPAEDFDYFRRCSNFVDLVPYSRVLVVRRVHASSLSNRVALRRHYDDNCKAVKKMYVDWQKDFSFIEVRRSWIKLQFMYIKASIKRFEIQVFVLSSIRIFFPILM